jgi:hypothetical protein
MLPSKTSQVNKNLDREHEFNGRNGEINTYPMVQNCIRKLPQKNRSTSDCNSKVNEIYSHAPATAIQPTSPPSGGSFVYRGGGLGLKSYGPSSRV